MAKVIGNIYEETDYTKFKKLSDNRDVLSTRLSKIVASFSVKQILNPIIVNEKMQIIDGQGRYEALKKLGRPIQYVIADGANNDDCKRMNRYNTKWSSLDFAKSYASSGNENYINLLKACSQSTYPITRCIRLANHATYKSHSGENVIESGKLIFTEEDIEKVLKYKALITEIQDALVLSKRINDAFVISVSVMAEFKGYNHKHMIENCKKQKNSFNLISGIEGMLKEFERIYNYRVPVNQRLYFSDYMRNKGYNTLKDYSSSQSEYDDVNVQTLQK